MTQKAQVVIIGSGIVGCATAYHLAKMGWKDVLVIDKGELFENDGSTSHAPGGVVPLSHNKLLTQCGLYTADLIASLDHFSQEQNTFNRVGQLEIAISESRWQDLKRLHGTAKAYHCETHLLTPQESAEKMPLLDPSQFVGSLYVPAGMIVKGAHVTGALAREAEAMDAAKFVGHTAMTDIEVKGGRVTAVLTNNPTMPRIECENVLLAANIWAPALSEKFGIHLPLMAFEHQYV
ncbi:MAG: FAD-binding oxidoreductase, partial [Anaerolineales bacterium]|nr:FAD-binding oxidoreductase [Anaerolineales bacterium]